jgi:hypothetical protein
VIPNSIATQRLDQIRFRSRRQLREHRHVAAAGSTSLERCIHVDADDVAAWRKPQLALASASRASCSWRPIKVCSR